MNVLVTGAKGFVGKNLVAALRQMKAAEVFGYDVDSSPGELERYLSAADVVFHLAGVNRPEHVGDYEWGNAGFTGKVCETLRRLGRAPVVVVSSSIQALLDNPYGLSKRRAETMALDFGRETGARVSVFRFPGIFGKWCRPNYNSVVATFCHNIARNLPISISNPAQSLDLVYVDDVCAAMLEAARVISGPSTHVLNAANDGLLGVTPVFTTTLGGLADTVRSFKDFRRTLAVPPLDDPFVARLYATYLSCLEDSDFAYHLEVKADNRGDLAEFVKASSFGQIFVSHTKPGVTRGNHYHHTKTEKFFVVQGKAIIRLRHILKDKVIEYAVSGTEYRVVDIPPGYAHSIENVGGGELTTLFWADQVFDPGKPDTFYEDVIKEGTDR
ncbi:MAG: NAD-dependent epimerase/dehydratase family protein [Syntrophorhabdales bacterium]|jgi:UDP-2-acetamido-2,6-beta-L-arabino-hexul-4-ose reductase